MKYDGKTITPNELAKLELLDKISLAFYDGAENSGWTDKKMTSKEAQQVEEQLQKRLSSIYKLLGAEKLQAKFFN